jgi:hypothetical protein
MKEPFTMRWRQQRQLIETLHYGYATAARLVERYRSITGSAG